jgi:hypothetical protein
MGPLVGAIVYTLPGVLAGGVASDFFWLAICAIFYVTFIIGVIAEFVVGLPILLSRTKPLSLAGFAIGGLTIGLLIVLIAYIVTLGPPKSRSAMTLFQAMLILLSAVAGSVVFGYVGGESLAPGDSRQRQGCAARTRRSAWGEH